MPSYPLAAWDTSRKIAREVAAIKKEYHTDDPRDIAEGMGIRIMARNLTGAPGVYVRMTERLAIIVLSSRLDWRWERLVIAHELGHHVLHGDMVRCTGDAFFGSTRFEYEANAFAAQLLIPTAGIKPLYFAGASYPEMMDEFAVPRELIDIKLLELSHYDKTVIIDTEPSPYFLRNTPLIA